jgi:hypothetical protein
VRCVGEVIGSEQVETGQCTEADSRKDDEHDHIFLHQLAALALAGTPTHATHIKGCVNTMPYWARQQ